jgi:hypothetical protein
VEKQKNLTNISTKYSENYPSCSESLNIALITGEQGGSKLCVVGTKGSIHRVQKVKNLHKYQAQKILFPFYTRPKIFFKKN